jgi:hypothetical protein
MAAAQARRRFMCDARQDYRVDLFVLASILAAGCAADAIGRLAH